MSWSSDGRSSRSPSVNDDSHNHRDKSPVVGILGPEQERERRHQKEMIKVHSLWKSAKEELTKALDELRHTKREADLAKRALDHVKSDCAVEVKAAKMQLETQVKEVRDALMREQQVEQDRHDESYRALEADLRKTRDGLGGVVGDLRRQLEVEEARRVREVSTAEERAHELSHAVRELRERVKQSDEAREYAIVEKAKHESLLMEKLAELEEIDQSYKLNMSQLAGREGEFSKTIQRLEGENKRLQEALKHTMHSWTEESRKQQQKEVGISKQSGDMAKSTSKALSKLSVAMEEIAQVRGEGRIKDERIRALEGQLMVAHKLVENERLEGAIRKREAAASGASRLAVSSGGGSKGRNELERLLEAERETVKNLRVDRERLLAALETTEEYNELARSLRRCESGLGEVHYVRADGHKVASLKRRIDLKWEEAHRKGDTELGRWVPAEAMEIAREYWGSHMKGTPLSHLEALLYVLNSVWQKSYQAMIKSERIKMKQTIASSKRKANEMEPLQNIVLQKQVSRLQKALRAEIKGNTRPKSASGRVQGGESSSSKGAVVRGGGAATVHELAAEVVSLTEENKRLNARVAEMTMLKVAEGGGDFDMSVLDVFDLDSSAEGAAIAQRINEAYIAACGEAGRGHETAFRLGAMWAGRLCCGSLDRMADQLMSMAKALHLDPASGLSASISGRPSYSRFTRSVLDCKRRLHHILEVAVNALTVESDSPRKAETTRPSPVAVASPSPAKSKSPAKTPGRHAVFSAYEPSPGVGASPSLHLGADSLPPKLAAHREETDRAISDLLSSPRSYAAHASNSPGAYHNQTQQNRPISPVEHSPSSAATPSRHGSGMKGVGSHGAGGNSSVASGDVDSFLYR